jgi:hypothetical protein
MSDLTDIAARTQRFRDAVRAFTPPLPTRYAKLLPLKDGIVELREKGASLRLIRELLLTVDVSVSIDTIARFLAEINGEKTIPRRVREPGNKRSVVRRTNEGQSASPARFSESSPAAPQIGSDQQPAAHSDRPRTRGPRVADPHNL